MRLDRPPAKIRSKSYSNGLLNDFFLSEFVVEIHRNRRDDSNFLILNSIYIETWWNNDYYQHKMTILDLNWQFSIKFDQIYI